MLKQQKKQQHENKNIVLNKKYLAYVSKSRQSVQYLAKV